MSQKIIYCDLDGTLIARGGKLSENNLNMLAKLQEAGVLTVLATGRNLYSLKKVVDSEQLWNYIVFSTGAGIVNWQSKEILQKRSLNNEQVQEITELLWKEQVDTMIQEEVPENHYFTYRSFSEEENCQNDFFYRLKLYRNFAEPWGRAGWQKKKASQLIAVLQENDERYEKLCEKLQKYSVIRATSPLDGRSIWLEIFAPGVSKAGAAEWLQNYKNSSAETYALGNDHNDFDLLLWAENSLIAKDSPIELKEKFTILNAEPEEFLQKAANYWKLI